MRFVITASIFVLATVLWSCSPGSSTNDPTEIAEVPAAQPAAVPKRLVLVELFTSEGCSSCPPADGALAAIKKDQPAAGADVITLAYHVDYWNALGWTDRFSSHEYSQRQETYAAKFGLDSIYTPQMVVDGSSEFAGNNKGRAIGEIETAAKTSEKGKAELSYSDGSIRAVFSSLPQTDGATVFLAVAEDNLSTDVERGENRGMELRHVSVVRLLREVGKVGPGETRAESVAKVEFDPQWKKEDLQIVVFAQDDKERKILAVGAVRPQN